jgi:threonine dehydratase
LSGPGPISLADVRAARATIGDRLHRTPVFSSATLGERIGAPAFLKAELFQRTGSFKPRGVLAKLASLTAREKARGVIGISAGNHAQALAYSAAAGGIDCLVVMWQGASEQKIEATRGYGAAVDLAASDPGQAFERLAELQEETGRTLVHPFDDPLVMAGQGTVALELLEDVPELGLVVVPVGGGGLIAGMAIALKESRPGIRVVGVEPERSDGLHAALAAGRPVEVTPRSIADGLSAPFAGEHCLEICRSHVDEVVLVTEAEIEAGMRFVYARAKLACEPAGAVGVAALLAGKVSAPATATAAVVSGGNVAARTASGILARDEA